MSRNYCTSRLLDRGGLSPWAASGCLPAVFDRLLHGTRPRAKRSPDIGPDRHQWNRAPPLIVHELHNVGLDRTSGRFGITRGDRLEDVAVTFENPDPDLIEPRRVVALLIEGPQHDIDPRDIDRVLRRNRELSVKSDVRLLEELWIFQRPRHHLEIEGQALDVGLKRVLRRQAGDVSLDDAARLGKMIEGQFRQRSDEMARERQFSADLQADEGAAHRIDAHEPRPLDDPESFANHRPADAEALCQNPLAGQLLARQPAGGVDIAGELFRDAIPQRVCHCNGPPEHPGHREQHATSDSESNWSYHLVGAFG